MKIHTDITTLSKLYPLFEKAGISGILSGDFSQIKDMTYPDLAAALLSKGDLSEICQIITKKDEFVSETQEVIAWEDISREDAMGIIIPFFVDITIGPIELSQIHQNLIQSQETSL